MTGQDGNKHQSMPGETEAWYRECVDQVRDLVQCVDHEGRFVYVNQAWHATLNYTAEEIAHITLWEIIHPDSMAHCRALFAQVLTGQTVGEIEAQFITKDGAAVLVEGSVSVKRDEHGRFVHTRGIFRDVTERKKMEVSLAAARAENRALLDAIPDFMFLFLVSKEGHFVDYKTSNDERLLLKPDAFMGKHIRDTLPPDLAELTLDRLAQLFESGKSQLYEYPLEIAGEQKLFESRLVPCGDDRALAIVRDITERKRSEEALRKSEERLSSILNNMIDTVWSITWPDFQHLYLSPALEKLYGRPAQEFYDNPTLFVEVTHPDDRHLTEKVIEQLVKEGAAVRECRIVRPGGSIVWVNDRSKMVYDENQQPVRVDGVTQDITERKRSEEALKASEEKYREILATMAEGYYEIDLAGAFVFFNESLCRMLGCSRKELMGESCQRFSQNSQEAMNSCHSVYKTGKPVTAVDWPALTRDGREIHLELSISLRRNEEGEPIGFRGVIRDITERRQADAKIRYLSYHDQLTGLYNRHYLEEEMKRLDTERQLPISIIMADLNGLKLVNDTYGHHTGDAMLKRSAEILKRVCRGDDILARFGGDEFVLYLPRTPEKEAHKISDRIEKACHREQINHVPLSLSTGVAVKVSPGQQLSDLLREAEDSMYRDKLTESRSGKSTIVNSLLQTLAAKSFETETHIRNMQAVANSIGEKLGLPHSELHRLQLLITLHDIGKINIPEELLTKTGSLAATEWEIMQKHCETGYRVARATDSFAHVAEDILAHHERWDGSGFPRGLKGEAIPLLARITTIADAYEVMSNGRPYKEAMSRSEIVTELTSCAGTQFDPELVELFLTVLEAVG